MSAYELAVGFKKEAVNKALAQLYAKSDARGKFFRNTVSVTVGGLTMRITWDLAIVPTASLTAPAEDVWRASYGPDGKPVTGNMPEKNVFQTRFSLVTAAIEDQKLSISNLLLISDVNLAPDGQAICIKPLALYEEDAGLSEQDKVLLNSFILPDLFKVAGNALGKIPLPPLAFTMLGKDVQFRPPMIAIAGDSIVLYTSRIDKPLSESSGPWPNNKSTSILLEPNFVLELLAGKVSSELKGYSKEDNGNNSGADYQYKLTINDLVSLKMADQTSNQVECKLNVDIQASATVLGSACSVSAASEKV